jgi:outer membrane protein assembly factor BamB
LAIREEPLSGQSLRSACSRGVAGLVHSIGCVPTLSAFEETTMRVFLVLAVVLLLTPTPASAQSYVPIYSRPALPAEAALDRLNLKMAWYAYLPTSSKRDGVLSFQVRDNQVFVQLLSGMVVALNADNGTTQWWTQVGVPYRATYPLGINSRLILAVNGPRFYGLDRQTGKILWEFDLPTAPTAAPVADDHRVFLCLTAGELSIYRFLAAGERQAEQIVVGRSSLFNQYDINRTAVSAMGRLSGYQATSDRATAGLQPKFENVFRADSILDQPPMFGQLVVTVGGSAGKFFSTPRNYPGGLYRFPLEIPSTALPAQHREIMYIATPASDLHAVNLENSRRHWIYTGDGQRILNQPAVNDEDVYIVPERRGLHRLNRATGELLWRNLVAERFLAANPKFVYAADINGRLLILDRKRGTLLADFDVRDFVVPIANELTDRVFLAANNGLVLCLRDREYVKPLKMKTVEEPKLEAPKPPADKPPANAPPAVGQE